MCGCASSASPTGDPARDPGMCPDQKLNQRPFGSQAGAQSTEPHQPGLYFDFYRERVRRGREREKRDVTEKHRLVASRTHPNEIKPATYVCAPIENRTCNLLVFRMTLQPNEPPSQG